MVRTLRLALVALPVLALAQELPAPDAIAPIDVGAIDATIPSSESQIPPQDGVAPLPEAVPPVAAVEPQPSIAEVPPTDIAVETAPLENPAPPTDAAAAAAPQDAQDVFAQTTLPPGDPFVPPEIPLPTVAPFAEQGPDAIDIFQSALAAAATVSFQSIFTFGSSVITITRSTLVPVGQATAAPEVPLPVPEAAPTDGATILFTAPAGEPSSPFTFTDGFAGGFTETLPGATIIQGPPQQSLSFEPAFPPAPSATTPGPSLSQGDGFTLLPPEGSNPAQITAIPPEAPPAPPAPTSNPAAPEPTSAGEFTLLPPEPSASLVTLQPGIEPTATQFTLIPPGAEPTASDFIPPFSSVEGSFSFSNGFPDAAPTPAPTPTDAFQSAFTPLPSEFPGGFTPIAPDVTGILNGGNGGGGGFGGGFGAGGATGFATATGTGFFGRPTSTSVPFELSNDAPSSQLAGLWAWHGMVAVGLALLAALV